MDKILNERVPIVENGRRRNVPKIELILRLLANNAIRGEEKSIRLLLARADRNASDPKATPGSEALLSEDLAILRDYYGSVIAIPDNTNTATTDFPTAGGAQARDSGATSEDGEEQQ